MRRVLGLMLLVLAGCPADDHSSPDATPGTGLIVGWVTHPQMVPGPVEDDYSLSSVAIGLRNLRVVGDAGAGDPRTTAPVVDLAWSDKVQPRDVAFPDAPPGLYSRMLASVERGAAPYAFELRGTVMTMTGLEPYVIRDVDALAVDMDFQIVADPGTSTTIVVRVELDDVLDAADFAAAPVIDGARTIETGDAQMPSIRSHLAEAFGVHASDQPP